MVVVIGKGKVVGAMMMIVEVMVAVEMTVVVEVMVRTRVRFSPSLWAVTRIPPHAQLRRPV